MLVHWNSRPAQIARWLAQDPWFGVAPTAAAPLADVSEDEAGYTIELELPGVKASEVQVDLDGGRLVITGEKKQETTDQTDRLHRVERRFGAFRRAFTVPDTVDRESIAAKLVDGVLSVRLLKKPVAKPRSIPVAG